MIKYLPRHLLGEALQLAYSVCNEDVTVAVFSHLAEHWAAVCRAIGHSDFEELSTALKIFATLQRGQLLLIVITLLPIIENLGGPQSIRETAKAISDTARWWP